MNRDSRSTASPVSTPYTGPIANRAPCAMPIRKAPATPSGDARNRARTPMGSGVSNTGARPTLRVIGIRAKETRTETSTNSSKLRGSYRFMRSWPLPMPPITMIMYTESNWPRVLFVAASLIQLSATT